MKEQKLGVWEEDPRSLAGARALESMRQHRQTLEGRVEAKVGRSELSTRPAQQTEMKPSEEYKI